MTSEDQRRANRANGRASAGPKTMAGKARVRLNAWGHGLATKVLTDTKWAPAVESLARQLAGENAKTDLLAMARKVAEHQVELTRMRAYRARRVEQAYSDPKFSTKRRQAIEGGIEANFDRGSTSATVSEREPAHDGHVRDDAKLGEVLTSMAKELAAIDRYERRALSRRKFAIREFDKLKADTIQCICALKFNSMVA
jgi:hypothetical protein